jgi:hypothetical protein
MIEGMEIEDPREKKIYWNFKEDALDHSGNSRWKKLRTCSTTDHARKECGKILPGCNLT